MLPPLTFSTIKFCLSFADNECATTRAVSSVGPPAGKGTMMVTVRLGYCCAETGAATKRKHRWGNGSKSSRHPLLPKMPIFGIVVWLKLERVDLKSLANSKMKGLWRISQDGIASMLVVPGLNSTP